MSVRYACSHLDTPAPPLPPSYPSSGPSFFPIEQLYFCEECDALRCDLCVGVEVASYFCPNCLFDVPGANVRGDRNRCARSCFSCPQCSSSLSIQASDFARDDVSGDGAPPGPLYLLVCPGCRWSSKQIGWEFEKPTGIALQVQKRWTQPERIQAEFDHIKDHLESYMTCSSSTPTTPHHRPRAPSRHISHLTQMAAKALNRPVHGFAVRKRPLQAPGGEKVGWDELEAYESKASWRELGLEKGMGDVEAVRSLEEAGWEGMAAVDRRWGTSWECDRMSKSVLPQRIPLRTKLTKRCPEPSCRHLLVQPDTKSVRMKIKMVALNYLPILEVGRRRRRVVVVPGGDTDERPGVEAHAHDAEREEKRRERRRTRPALSGISWSGGEKGEEEDEAGDRPLVAGETYTFQLALTNPLYDPIQIRLTRPPLPKHAPPEKCEVRIATPHFTCNASKDAWAYDDEEDGDGSEDAAGTGTMRKGGRLGVLAGGSLRDKRREAGVEKRGNVSKVPIEVEISEQARGDVEFDLEVRFTYRVEGEGTGEKGREEYKHFTFWARVHLGEV